MKSRERLRFAIRFGPFPYGDPVVAYEGQSIGHKAICRFPLIKTKTLWLDVVESEGPAALRSIELFNTTV